MPKIFLLIIIIASILYQIDFKKNNKNSNYEETLINLSRFIIISGIFGYVSVRIVGLFVNKFN